MHSVLCRCGNLSFYYVRSHSDEAWQYMCRRCHDHAVYVQDRKFVDEKLTKYGHEEIKMKLPKYTPADIDRIFDERVTTHFRKAELKAGLVCEYLFTFPNGNKSIDVTYAFAMDEANNDEAIAKSVCKKNIKEHLWQICGKYTLATGEML